MGIWDNVSSMLGKGADAAGRFANATNLKFKLGEEQRKRRDLAAELGESLYETVAANPSLAAGRERILADMAACDAEIARIKEEVDRIAQENEALKAEPSPICVLCAGARLPAMHGSAPRAELRLRPCLPTAGFLSPTKPQRTRPSSPAPGKSLLVRMRSDSLLRRPSSPGRRMCPWRLPSRNLPGMKREAASPCA